MHCDEAAQRGKRSRWACAQPEARLIEVQQHAAATSSTPGMLRELAADGPPATIRRNAQKPLPAMPARPPATRLMRD